MDKNARICIIGGGAAGLSAAMYLEKAGYRNYTVYEKSDRVGGQAFSPCMTVTLEDGTQEERHFDMGAALGECTCYAVDECAEFGGLPRADGPHFARVKIHKDGSLVDYLALEDLRSGVRQIGKLLRLLDTKYYGSAVNGHRGVSKGCYEGICPNAHGKLEHIEGTNPELKDLALPFREFLKKNQCEAASFYFTDAVTSFGYGYFDEIPAAYVFKCLDPFVIRQNVQMDPTPFSTWHNGTQSIWEGVNRHLEHPAERNSEVTRVRRAQGKVCVTVNDREEMFDQLILCVPLDAFLRYGDPRQEEQELFSKIRYNQYFTMAVRLANDRMGSAFCTILEHMTPETRGHLMAVYHRWQDVRSQPAMTYTLRNYPGLEDIPLETAKQLTLQDLDNCGLKPEKVERLDEWVYFPHVSSADYAKGWYERVEAMQGVDGTYYAGEIMSFSDMEEVVEYSRELVRRFFP